jgi:anti-anti-sigma factor
MGDFSVQVERMHQYAVLRSDGYINNLGGEQIARECFKLLDDNCTVFIFNLEKSKVVNSIGISILIEIIEKVIEKNGRLVFCHLTPTIAKTFRIMGLLQYAEHAADESTAIKTVSSGNKI